MQAQLRTLSISFTHIHLNLNPVWERWFQRKIDTLVWILRWNPAQFTQNLYLSDRSNWWKFENISLRNKKFPYPSCVLDRKSLHISYINLPLGIIIFKWAVEWMERGCTQWCSSFNIKGNPYRKHTCLRMQCRYRLVCSILKGAERFRLKTVKKCDLWMIGKWSGACSS